MSNKNYNTRHSGRYNIPGQFIPASNEGQNQPQYGHNQQQSSQSSPLQALRKTTLPAPPLPPQLPQMQQTPLQTNVSLHQAQAVNNSNLQQVQMASEDVVMKTEPNENEGQDNRPHWMKSKLAGGVAKKVSNKERRRRQNETLRRLLTPKNALMALYEMMPKDTVNSQFKVEPAGQAGPHGGGQYYGRPPVHSFCADLTLEGSTYKGYGDNKMNARNAAAEQAIRDLMIKRMNKAVTTDASSAGGSQNGDETMEGGGEEEALPMIQLASFALHKLFAVWEYEGHKVPQLKPNPNAQPAEAEGAPAPAAAPAAAPRAPKPKPLPVNAAQLHPCMLLSYLRPKLQYRQLAQDGASPHDLTFTLGVDVDGTTYIGKASSKKEARRLAAKSACQEIFGVQFEANAVANTPVPAPIAT